MAKMDIKCAFRIIPVHPLEYPLLGITWANEYYFDRCLVMGLKSSCASLKKFSSSLEWLAMQLLHASAVLHILDVFLFIAPSRVKCSEDLHKFSICATFSEYLFPRTEQWAEITTELSFECVVILTKIVFSLILSRSFGPK